MTTIYSEPPVVVTGQTMSAANWNTWVVDVAKALWPYTAAGQIQYASAANLLAGLSKPSVDSVLKNTSLGVPSWIPESSYKMPIGSVFIAVVATNPNTLLGYGTWAAFGTGRTLVGIDAGQAEFDVVEETGGAKTHTLTTTEMPAHTHTYNAAAASVNNVPSGTTYGMTVYNPGQVTGSAGSGGAHNNLQPYIVVYMWKRTA